MRKICGCRRSISAIPGWCAATTQASFESYECRSLDQDGSCPAFDRLLGSRVAIFNAEVRFPLWGAFGGSNFYGPLPIEMAFFADSGVAWGQSNSVLFGGANKEPVIERRRGDARQSVRLRGRRARFRHARSIGRAAAGSGSSI